MKLGYKDAKEISSRINQMIVADDMARKALKKGNVDSYEMWRDSHIEAARKLRAYGLSVISYDNHNAS